MSANGIKLTSVETSANGRKEWSNSMEIMFYAKKVCVVVEKVGTWNNSVTRW